MTVGERPSQGAALASVLAFVGCFLTNMGMMAFVAPGQNLLNELALTKVQFGIVQGANAAGNVAAMLAYCTRWRGLGDRTVLLCAFAALVAGNAVSSMGSVEALVLGRLLIGGAGSSCTYVMSRLAFRDFPSHRTLLVGLVHVAYLAGSLLVMAIGGAWYAGVGRWSHVSLVLALLPLLPLGLVLWGCPARRPGIGASPVRHSLGAVVRPAGYRRTLPAVGTYLLGEGAVAYFLPLYVQNHLGGSTVQVAAAATFFLSALLAGRLLLCGVLNGRDETRVLPWLASAAWTVLLAVLLPLPFALRAGLLAVGGFLLGPVAVLEVNLGVRLSGGSLDDGIVVTNVTLAGGGVVGSVLVGWLGQHYGLPFGMGVALLGSLAAVVPLWGLARPPLRD